MASWRTCTTFAVFTLVVMCVWCDVAEGLYTHQFALIVRGGPSTADRLSEKYGYINHGQIGSLEDHYMFSHQKAFKRSTMASTGSHTNIADEPEVEWFEQQVLRKRVKRDSTHLHQFTDSLWSHQWYMDGNFTGDSRPTASMNIQQAWDMGYTGAGIVITIMDDGLEYTHTDIRNNYDSEASYDFVSRDADPFPVYIPMKEDNMHGTRCAGEIVMQPNNSKCGVGIAFGAQIGGIRMLDLMITDEMEGASLSFNLQHVDIYSASWGPDDGGYTVEGPADITQTAMRNGVAKGRDGKGSIFVWASGNGGADHDDCNADGYANSIYTLVVSSTTENQDRPFYSEHCSASLASTYSSGNKNQKMVVTTDLHDQCIGNFSGTSASAPMAAGIISLALQANGNLTWRDVQYLVVVTSKRHQLSGEWITNGAGYEASHWFGFGLMNAAAMVEKAKTWETLPEQLTCSKFADNVDQSYFELFSSFIRRQKNYNSELEVTSCTDPFQGGAIQHLEHVQVTLQLNARRRGDVVVKLTSPSGTTSTLLSQRFKDRSRLGFKRWTLMSVHFWGESPIGTWRIQIGNGEYNAVNVRMVRLTLRGTESLPASLLPPPDTTTMAQEETEQPEREGAGEVIRRPGRPELQSTPGRGRHVSPLRVVSETLQRDVRAASSSSLSWDSSWWWSSSDWESFQECHEECLYGCSGPNADECYKCRHYKDRDTLNCVPTCPDGQFTPPELHIRCGRCSVHCKTCSGNSKHHCLSCATGLFLGDNNDCVKACEAGYYKDPFFQMCRQCSPLCKSCEGNENQCTSCIDGAVLRGSQCITRCMESEYMENERCQSCHPSCFSCNGGLETQCTACYNDYVHKDMRCVLPTQCSEGYYIVNSFDAGSRQCLRCHSTCKACQGPSFTDCVDCHPQFFLVGGACLQTCENGKFLDPDTGNCKSCSDGCVLCADEHHCIQCAASKVLRSAIIDDVDSIICREGCEDGKYSMGGECFPCHSTCETCNGGGIMDCTQCKQSSDTLKYLLEGACVHYCPDGYFKYDRGDSALIHTCELCDDSCKTCTGYGSDECTECEDGLIRDGNLRCVEPSDFDCTVPNCEGCLNGIRDVCHTCAESYYLDNAACVLSCPPGKVGVPHTRRCELCHPTCETCEGSPDTCTTCDDEYFYDDFDNLCLTQCPEDMYDDARRICQDCDEKCASCVGAGPDNCKICYEMDEFLSGTSCVTECPKGQYGDEYTGTCRSCHPSCVTCAGPGDHECDSCLENFELELGFCRSSCTDRSYKDSEGNCQACDTTCQTCTGTGPNMCLSCNYYNFLAPTKACVTDCPEFYYPDYESNVCRRCDPSCKTCLDSGPGDCIECASNTYMLLRNGQLCVEDCPEGYYDSEELGFRDCRQCSVECRDCDDSYLTCISCYDGTYLFQGRCFSTCPSGYIEDSETNHCIQHANICPLYCDQCDDWGDCTVCQGTYIVYFGECVNEHDMACLTDQYIISFTNDGTALCGQCDPSCGTCLGPDDTDCVTCASAPQHHFQGSRCVQACEDTKFKDEDSNECFDCHPTCLNCDAGSPSDCTSCIEGMQLSDPVHGHGMCQFGCPEGHYLDSHGECLPCSSENCFTCYGPDESQCLSCNLGYLRTATGACVENCPEYTYEYLLEDAMEGNECRPCHQSCSSCNGPGPISCTSCRDEMVLARGECGWDCEEGYYPDTESQCQRCDTACQTCIGIGSACTSCRIDQVLLGATCVDECGDGYFTVLENVPVCHECDDLCLSCTDYGPFDCTSCHPNYQLDNGVCYNRCGSGRYYDRNENKGVRDSATCGLCDANCAECFGPSPDQCISCKGLLRLEKVDRNNSRCIPCCNDVQDNEECCERCDDPDTHKCPKVYVHNTPAVVGGVKKNHIGTIVFCVLLVIVLFFVVFGLLQARSHGKLCWSHKYAKVPSMNYNIKDKYVALGKPDDDYYEEDIYGDVSDDEEEDLEEPDTFQTVGITYQGQDRNGMVDHL